MVLPLKYSVFGSISTKLGVNKHKVQSGKVTKELRCKIEKKSSNYSIWHLLLHRLHISSKLSGRNLTITSGFDRNLPTVLLNIIWNELIDL